MNVKEYDAFYDNKPMTEDEESDEQSEMEIDQVESQKDVNQIKNNYEQFQMLKQNKIIEEKDVHS